MRCLFLLFWSPDLVKREHRHSPGNQFIQKMESLRPNRDLLDPKFEGYKLSLEPLTLSSTNLLSAVNDILLREELFSFQHMRAFGNLNHLVVDSWLDGGKHEVVYFVNENYEVQRAAVKVSRL